MVVRVGFAEAGAEAEGCYRCGSWETVGRVVVRNQISGGASYSADDLG